MDERRMQRRVGWGVLFTLTFLGVLLVINNPAASPFRSGGYELFIDLASAPGVAVNTPVRKDGVLVGRVADLEWTDAGIRLKVRIDRDDVVIYQSDKPEVEPSSIFGDAVVAFSRQPVQGERVPILAGAVVNGEVTADPLTAITQLNQNLGPSIEKLGDAGEKVAQLADKINTVLGDDIGKQRIQEVMDELMATLTDFRRTTNNFDQLLADNELRGQLTDALREFPGLMNDARGTLQQAGSTLKNFDAVIAGADRNLRNIEGLTAPLGEKGEEIADLLISAVDNLDIVLADLSRFAKSLINSEGTIGRFVNDPKLYDDTDLLIRDTRLLIGDSRTMIKNANVVVTRIYEFTKDFRPIVDDLRVFSYKIATEPGRLIGGAIKPSVVK